MRVDELFQRVHSPEDPRIADYRVVKERETLAKRGVFIGEGRLVVERLLSARRRFPIRSLLLQDTRVETVRGALEGAAGELCASATPIYVAGKAVMDAIVGFKFHQGCLAAGALPAEGSESLGAGALLREALGRAGALVVLEDLVDLDNVGSCFRNGAALGAAGVLLSPRCASPLYRKALRTSMGHAALMAWGVCAAWPGDLALVKRAGYRVAALTPREGAVAVEEFARLARGERVALMVGTEGEGLSEAALAAADVWVRIPMAGGVDSLNVATALAVALHAVSSAR